MDRRNFFGVVVGAALPSSIEALAKSVEGFLVVNLYVGRLPPVRAEAFVLETSKKLRDNFDKRGLKKWEVIVHADRVYATNVEVYTRNPAGAMEELKPVYVDFFEERPKLQEIFDQVQEYVLLMLGAPVIKIELTAEQLKFCIRLVVDIIDAHKPNGLLPAPVYIYLVREGALAHAKIILGRIRSKSLPGLNDGETLLSEGQEEYHDWLGRVAI